VQVRTTHQVAPSLQCLLGHPLPLFVIGPGTIAGRWACDLCERGPYDMKVQRFRCTECNFDVCFECSDNHAATRLPNDPPVPARKKRATQFTCKQCRQVHAWMSTQGGLDLARSPVCLTAEGTPIESCARQRHASSPVSAMNICLHCEVGAHDAYRTTYCDSCTQSRAFTHNVDHAFVVMVDDVLLGVPLLARFPHLVAERAKLNWFSVTQARVRPRCARVLNSLSCS
jgi:hypothetical protein